MARELVTAAVERSLNARDRLSAESGNAEERALAALRALKYASCNAMGTAPFEEHEAVETSSGHLVSRSHVTVPPNSLRMPGLSAILQVSWQLSPLLLGHSESGPSPQSSDSDLAAARLVVACRFRSKIEQVVPVEK